MTADECGGALLCAFHRAQVIKPTSARHSREHRAEGTRKELGSLGQLRTVWASRGQAALDRAMDRSSCRSSMAALTRSV
jgi:hypothetical protein